MYGEESELVATRPEWSKISCSSWDHQTANTFQWPQSSSLAGSSTELYKAKSSPDLQTPRISRTNAFQSPKTRHLPTFVSALYMLVKRAIIFSYFFFFFCLIFYYCVYCSPAKLFFFSPSKLPNYMQYLAHWSRVNEEGEFSSFTNLTPRPNRIGMLHDNTTVEGIWLNVRDMAADSKKLGRIINDVTMEMPHAGVSAASRDPSNNIIQPNELNVSILPLL